MSTLPQVDIEGRVRWLITGGCGFIGRSLVTNLVREGSHFIRVLDDLSVGTKEDLAQVCDLREVTRAELLRSRDSRRGDRVELFAGDVRDPACVQVAAAGCAVVVHLAAETGVGPSVEDPRTDCLVNVLGTLNCLEAARGSGVKRFVFASSGAPLGMATNPVHEELPARPMSPYGASKLAGEGYCSAYFHSFGLDTVALRFGNVYGPHSAHKQSIVAKFIRRAFEGLPLEIYGDGSQTRDYIFIDDLVSAIRAAVSAPQVGGEVFQIATARETSVAELTALLVQLLKSQAGIDVDVKNEAPRIGDAPRLFSNTGKARKLLGWQAGVGLPEGLRFTLDWYLGKRGRGDSDGGGVGGWRALDRRGELRRRSLGDQV